MLCSSLAAAVISIGTFAKIVMTPVQGASSPDSIPSALNECAKEEFMRGMEFGGFSSWSSFTEHCCCMPRTQVANSSSSSLTYYVVLLTELLPTKVCVKYYLRT